MATIYEITDSFRLIQSLIEEGVEETVFAEALANNKMDLTEKLEGYAMVMKNVESDIEGLKAEEKRLSERRKSMESKIKRMKMAMHDAMSSTGEQKIQSEKFTFAIQKNPPSLKVVDESLIPSRYFIESKPTLDKKSLMEYLKEHGNMPGAQITQGESLRIR